MKIKTASTGFIIGLFLLGSVIIWLSSISLSRTNQIQSIWLEFEANRSDRLRALIAIRSELGYGGMIHRFKNYILRQSERDSKAIISSLGGARAALDHYKSLQLSPIEKQSIKEIEQTLDAYRNSLNQINALIKQGKTAKYIDNVVKIDDLFALNALKVLEHETKFVNSEIFDSNTKPILLSSLRTAMGYGGLIHNFKNYILRYTPDTANQVTTEVVKIEGLIELYKKHNLSSKEQDALADILSVVHAYQQKLPIIKELIILNNLPRTIDRVVIVDDLPALDGFHSLQREIIRFNEVRATQLNNALQVVQLSGKVIFYITLSSFLILIFLAIWMMNSLIVKPISSLTRIMTLLSHNNLNIDVIGTEQNSEIGEMARAVEVFKINTIKKVEAENALKNLNDQLEEKVHQRTKKIEENEVRLESMAQHAIEGEERLKIIINTAMDAVIQIDQQGFVINWNKQAETIFGWTANEVIGELLHNLIIPKQFIDQHIAGIKRFLATEKATILNQRIEIIAIHHDGYEFPIELTISPIKYKGCYQFSAFIRDITQQKKAEQTIIKAKDEAEAANIAKSTFLANMSHELRTPMHGILSFSKIGIKKSDTATREKLHKYFSNINISGDRLLILLNDLLDLSKIEAGKLDLQMEQGDLAEIFSSCYAEQEQRIHDLSLKVQLIQPDYSMTGVFDILRIKQVITNLLSNAIKFSPKESTIKVTLAKNDMQSLCFSLQDEGIGIPEEELKTVFDAFIQSSKTKTGAGGTGLGLAICKEIIKGHNGEIWAKNNSEDGAFFKFIIPV